MNKGEAAYRMVSGGRTPRTERRMSLQGRMTEIERAAGTKTAAARQAGVTLRTWQRWRAGTQRPRPATLRRVEQVHRESRNPGRRGRILAGTGTLVIEGSVRVSDETRIRTISFSMADVDPANRRDLIDAYESGSVERLSDALDAVVEDYWPGMDLSNVESIRFG